jgi:hypothetical protein
MGRVLALLAGVFFAACTSAERSAAIQPPGADAAITAWARARARTHASTLPGTTLIEPVDILYGDFTGDGQADALAFAYFDVGGSAAHLIVTLFRHEDGRMTFMRTVDDVYGLEPRNARFSKGRIVLTTTVPNPGDPHCCPTGSQDWTIRTEELRK